MGLEIYRQSAINSFVKNEYVFTSLKNQKFYFVFQNTDFVDYFQILFLLKEFCVTFPACSDNAPPLSLKLFNSGLNSFLTNRTKVPSIFTNNSYLVSFFSLWSALRFLLFIKTSFTYSFIYPSLLGDYIARRYTSTFSGFLVHGSFFPDFTALNFFNLVEVSSDQELFFQTYLDLLRTCDFLFIFYVNI